MVARDAASAALFVLSSDRRVLPSVVRRAARSSRKTCAFLDPQRRRGGSFVRASDASPMSTSALSPKCRWHQARHSVGVGRTRRRGHQRVLFGDDRDALRSDVQQHSRAPRSWTAARMTKLVAWVIDLIESSTSSADEPLDLHGTEFQRSVWKRCGRSGRNDGELRRDRQAIGNRIPCAPWR